MSAIDKIKKSFHFILLEDQKAYSDENGNIIYFKTAKEAFKFLKENKIVGIVK